MDRVNAYIGRMEMTSDPIIEYLRERQAESVCDAGCGCGIYSLKLALNGFSVSGFDISPAAVELAKKLLTTFFAGAIISNTEKIWIKVIKVKSIKSIENFIVQSIS